MSLPVVYIQIAQEGRIIELRMECFDLADELADKIKTLGTRTLSDVRWSPDQVAVGEQMLTMAELKEQDPTLYTSLNPFARRMMEYTEEQAGVTPPLCETVGCQNRASHQSKGHWYCSQHGYGDRGIRRITE